MFTKLTKSPAEERDDPRRTFETAISELQRRVHPRKSRTPIALRPNTPAGDSAAEKRVLTDAARALARLWNVSPALIRR